MYAHNTWAGSEISMHQTLRELMLMGHQVRVQVGDPSKSCGQTLVLDNIVVAVNSSPEAVAVDYDWADIVVTEHEAISRCLVENNGRIPVVFFSHVRGHITQRLEQLKAVSLVVANSTGVAEEARLPVPHFVFHPPVLLKDYETKPAGEGGVLQVNLSEHKGGHIFWQLARLMPGCTFHGVLGGWGVQVIPPADRPRNVELWPNVQDPRGYYSRATILIMPTLRETYGRVALEAACSGIPAILPNTPGLREAMGEENAIWVERDKPQAWMNALASLLDHQFYATMSDRARHRAEQADCQTRFELAALENALLSAASDNRSRVWAFASEPHYVDHAWPYLSCVSPSKRGPLVVPWVDRFDPKPALLRAYTAGAVVVNLGPFRHKKQHEDALEYWKHPDFPGSVCVVVSQRDYKTAEAWFPKRIVRGEHGAGQTYVGLDHHSFAGGPGHTGCLAATAPNATVAVKIQAAHPSLPVAPVGPIKLYAMKQAIALQPREPDSKLLVLSFRYPGTEGHCQELASAWGHYSDMPDPVGWKVAVHLHPRARGGPIEAWARKRGWEIITEFWEVVRRGAVLAVDNSSLAVEWYYLRPCGNLILMNQPSYRQWVNHGLRFWDMSEWPGVYSIDGPGELPVALETAEAFQPRETDPGWFAEPKPASLRQWLEEMTRPGEGLVKMVALLSFGKRRKQQVFWARSEDAELYERKHYAARLPVNLEVDPGEAGIVFPEFESEVTWRWIESQNWKVK